MWKLTRAFCLRQRWSAAFVVARYAGKCLIYFDCEAAAFVHFWFELILAWNLFRIRLMSVCYVDFIFNTNLHKSSHIYFQLLWSVIIIVIQIYARANEILVQIDYSFLRCYRIATSIWRICILKLVFINSQPFYSHATQCQ